jgi:hypothetical protein
LVFRDYADPGHHNRQGFRLYHWILLQTLREAMPSSISAHLVRKKGQWPYSKVAQSLSLGWTWLP